MHRLQVFHLSRNFMLRLYDVLELLKLLSFCLGGFCIRSVSVPVVWESVSMMWSICAALICLCLEDFGLIGGSLSLCVVMVSVVFEGLRLELCALCAEIQWALFGVSGYLPELSGVFVLDIKPLALGYEVPVQELRIWKLADMIPKPGTWHADCVLLSVSLVSWNLSLYHN